MRSQEMATQISYYGTLTAEEKARMHPCKKERCVMMSGDSPPPLQTRISLVDCDMPDDARSGKISPTIPTTPITTKLLNSDTDTEAIENAVSVVQKVLPVPEPEPKIERNGIDTKAKKPANQTNDDSCVIDCIYYTQQCCECVII